MGERRERSEEPKTLEGRFADAIVAACGNNPPKDTIKWQVYDLPGLSVGTLYDPDDDLHRVYIQRRKPHRRNKFPELPTVLFQLAKDEYDITSKNVKKLSFVDGRSLKTMMSHDMLLIIGSRKADNTDSPEAQARTEKLAKLFLESDVTVEYTGPTSEQLRKDQEREKREKEERWIAKETGLYTAEAADVEKVIEVLEILSSNPKRKDLRKAEGIVREFAAII